LGNPKWLFLEHDWVYFKLGIGTPAVSKNVGDILGVQCIDWVEC